MVVFAVIMIFVHVIGTPATYLYLFFCAHHALASNVEDARRMIVCGMPDVLQPSLLLLALLTP